MEETLTLYSDGGEFMKAFNPTVQLSAAQNVYRVYFGSAPSLTTIKDAYTVDVLRSWLKIQLNSINDIVAVAGKIEGEQLDELSNMIIVEYPNLKASEVMLFIHRFKCGQYGESYGVIDPQRIMSGLIKFMKDRAQEMTAIEYEIKSVEMERKRKEWAETAISREEYERRKSQKPHE